MKTTLPKADSIERKWWLIDAKDLVLGRMSVKIANLLRGRHKAIFTPHIDTGDHVVVINAEKVKVTGNKENQKDYMFYTGYFGKRSGLVSAPFVRHVLNSLSNTQLRGCFKNKLAREMIKKLKIYAGEEHPHEAQNPQTIEI